MDKDVVHVWENGIETCILPYVKQQQQKRCGTCTQWNTPQPLKILK